MKKRTLKEEVSGENFKVAIFGSARIGRSGPRYQTVKSLAKMLGEQGIDIVTGGGPGLMEAANKGHRIGISKSKKKAHSIGLGIKLPREQTFNKYLDIKQEFRTFTKRLDKFMLLSNAVVVAPGGVGTLLELFYTWQLVQVDQICDIPIILLGKQWKPLLKWLKNYPLRNKFISRRDIDLLFVVDSPKDVMEIISDALLARKSGEKNFCLNYKKYKVN